LQLKSFNMKNAFGFLAILAFVSLFSCQDAREGAPSSGADLSAYSNVGMKISTETGARWIQAYNQMNTSARLGILYSVNRADLENAITSIDNLTGVAFQYGTDGNGEKHIIVIPIDQTLRLWTSVPGRIYIDANTSSEISQEMAQSWADNYQAANPYSIWFHYFGRNVFDEILTSADFAAVDIMPALNDLDLSQELLLVVGNTLDLLGRTNTETDVYDASYPCPKCAVQ
jgi:hypothetical protein